jgi:hypothetical protein
VVRPELPAQVLAGDELAEPGMERPRRGSPRDRPR